MIQRVTELLPDLYEADETAWLEAMSELIQQGRIGELDYPHLQEYLADMARRDRREVKSRLATLILHLLKWTYQPQNRSGSWQSTIIEQQEQLEDLLESGVLRNHAAAVLTAAYARAVKQAIAETGLPANTFAAVCPFTVEQILSADFVGE